MNSLIFQETSFDYSNFQQILLIFGAFITISKGFIFFSSDKERKTGLRILLNSYKFSLFILEDPVAVKIWSFVQNVRDASRFYTKNIHSKGSLIDIFANFLENEESSSGEEDYQIIKKVFIEKKYILVIIIYFFFYALFIFFNQNIHFIFFIIKNLLIKKNDSEKSIQDMKKLMLENVNIFQDLLKQCRYLQKKDLETLLLTILDIAGDSLQKNVEIFGFYAGLALETFLSNKDRIDEQLWEKFSSFLIFSSTTKIKLNLEELDAIFGERIKEIIFNVQSVLLKKIKKKQHISFFLQNILKGYLLKICIKFLHICENFKNFSKSLEEGLIFLEDCSSELILQVIIETEQILHGITQE